MHQYQYDFSVVMAVYNVKEYLREAVESLVHQTFGFSRIQLILVDDGSTDGSGGICDEYHAKYPENVVVVHKENGGVSSARNAGLPYVKGRYLNFMDSDDRFAHDAFQKVFSFFTRHETETDVVAVPMHFFDGETGEHIQNRKFTLGTELLDLNKVWDITNLSASASFIVTDSAEGLRFDDRLTNAEDAKYVLSILMDKMKLGLVKETRYWYRKRTGETESAIQSSEKRSTSYTPYLKWFSNWALDTAKERFGEIPKFVQYEVMYDLQWKLRQEKIPEGVLNETEKEEYRQLLVSTACRIDDDVILLQRNMELDRKLFVLRNKYRQEPELYPVTEEGGLQNIELRFEGHKSMSVGEMKTVLEFIDLDEQQNACTVEGYHIICGSGDIEIEPCLVVNGKEITCQKSWRHEKVTCFGNEKLCDAIGFKGKFPLTETTNKVFTAIKMLGKTVDRTEISVGPFFPASPIYDKAYYLSRRHMVSFGGSCVVISNRPSITGRTIREIQFLKEIWRKDLLGGRKAVFGRLYYHILKPFKRRKLWIISDRIVKADDNGEALFCYLQKHCPLNTKVIFAISKDSTDYARMSQIGQCVDAMSFRHKLLHLLCDVNISSAADGVTVNPYDGHHDALRDLLVHQKFIFLQHGITVNDLSGWLNRYNKNIYGFVTAAVRERNSIVDGSYHYSSERIWLTGFPRHDRLYHKEKNVITVMPTWRKYLMKGIDNTTGRWTVSDLFYGSGFYRFYNRLLSDDRLLRFLEEHEYTLQFFPHPTLQPVLGSFDHDTRVRFMPASSSYRDIYAESRLVVTDYSSASYDFSYLRKPVIYCQFDREEFYSGDHVCEKGYFDYGEDGFGEVVHDLESTIDLIMEYVSSGCELKEKYRKRIDDFFAFNDQDNCRRVADKIMSLSGGN